jgi:translation initiation factor IF-2
MGPRIWAVALVVVLVVGIAVGIGILAKPKPPKPQKAAATSALPTPTARPPAANAAPQPDPRRTAPRYVPPPRYAPAPYVPPVYNPGVAPQYQPAPRVAPAPAPRRTTTAPRPAPAPAPRPAATAPRRPDYSATTGYGCKENTSLVFTQHGFYASGRKGWLRVATGAYRSAVCDGHFDSMPMSGSATKDDPDNYATWQFRTGRVTRGSCRVSMFIPNDSSILHVGGRPSTYLIYAGWNASGTAKYAVRIDQVRYRGKWVTVRVPISSGAVAVKLLSRGIDYNSHGPTYAHHAVAQVHVDCYRG